MADIQRPRSEDLSWLPRGANNAPSVRHAPDIEAPDAPVQTQTPAMAPPTSGRAAQIQPRMGMEMAGQLKADHPPEAMMTSRRGMSTDWVNRAQWTAEASREEAASSKPTDAPKKAPAALKQHEFAAWGADHLSNLGEEEMNRLDALMHEGIQAKKLPPIGHQTSFAAVGQGEDGKHVQVEVAGHPIAPSDNYRALAKQNREIADKMFAAGDILGAQKLMADSNSFEAAHHVSLNKEINDHLRTFNMMRDDPNVPLEHKGEMFAALYGLVDNGHQAFMDRDAKGNPVLRMERANGKYTNIPWNEEALKRLGDSANKYASDEFRATQAEVGSKEATARHQNALADSEPGKLEVSQGELDVKRGLMDSTVSLQRAQAAHYGESATGMKAERTAKAEWEALRTSLVKESDDRNTTPTRKAEIAGTLERMKSGAGVHVVQTADGGQKLVSNADVVSGSANPTSGMNLNLSAFDKTKK